MWATFPPAVEVLITHGPPLGHGDLCHDGHRAGCADLLDWVEGNNPKIHVFGHIHEGYGATTNGRTLFLNASSVDENYTGINPPMVIDIPCGPPEVNITVVAPHGAPHSTPLQRADAAAASSSMHPDLDPEAAGGNRSRGASISAGSNLSLAGGGGGEGGIRDSRSEQSLSKEPALCQPEPGSAERKLSVSPPSAAVASASSLGLEGKQRGNSLVPNSEPAR